MAEVKNSSALACLGILFSQVRREVNFNALLTADIAQNLDTEEGELQMLMKLADNQKLEPVQLDSLEQAAKNHSGPALIRRVAVKRQQDHSASGQQQGQDILSCHIGKNPFFAFV